MAHGGKRPGAGRKRGGQDDPQKALVKATDRIVAELAIAITGDITALGKEGLRPAGGEPWRGHVGGVDESFFWGGATGKRAWVN